MDDLFLADKLHMNAKGYAIWQRIIQRNWTNLRVSVSLYVRCSSVNLL